MPRDFSTGKWLNWRCVVKRLSWHWLWGLSKGKWPEEKETYWKAVIVGNDLVRGNKGLKVGHGNINNRDISTKMRRHRWKYGRWCWEVLIENWISMGLGKESKKSIWSNDSGVGDLMAVFSGAPIWNSARHCISCTTQETLWGREPCVQLLESHCCH